MNLPNSKFDSAHRVMIVGVGGGYDVFTGLPFVYHNNGMVQDPYRCTTTYHKDRAETEKNINTRQFVLVNSSPSSNFHYRQTTPEDHPECSIQDAKNIAKYTVGRHGVKAIKTAYQEIITKHDIELVLAIDGGVDSLMRGDEVNYGTILEDFISLAALDEIKEVDKLLCCAGFGTETEEDLNHYRVLENIAALIRDGHFIGSFSLTKDMPEFRRYVEECETAWLNGKRKSHIQTKIISAILGVFGDRNWYHNVDAQVANAKDVIFISPLASIYWLFNFDGVIKKNNMVRTLKESNTFADAKILLKNFLSTRPIWRPKEVLPL